MERWGLPNLPHEIVCDILSRLPVKPLCRFKSVSKPWLALITDPHFIKSHLHQSTKSNTNQKLIIPPQYFPLSFASLHAVDYQAPDHTVAELKMPCESHVALIWGSFNGVLLLNLDDGLFLWNPSVRMYRKFSRPESSRCFKMMYALGYDSINDDFKVIAAVCPLRKARTIVHVFSSKLSSWKSIGDFGYSSYIHGQGNVLDGAPHWFVRGNTDVYFNIVCFDVVEEKLKEVPKPMYEVEDYHFVLGVLGGWLCVVDKRLESHSDVWVMKEYGVKASWTKLFVVPNVPSEFFFHYFDLLCFTKDGDVVVRLNLEELAKLVIYDPKQKTYKRIGMPQDWKRFDVTVYVESLVSPHGCNST